MAWRVLFLHLGFCFHDTGFPGAPLVSTHFLEIYVISAYDCHSRTLSFASVVEAIDLDYYFIQAGDDLDDQVPNMQLGDLGLQGGHGLYGLLGYQGALKKLYLGV